MSTKYECAVCLTERDIDYEDEPIILGGEKVCGECRQLCDGNCGEYLTDDSIRIGGPIVHYRDWALNGQLQTSHASCAAETILRYFDHEFDYDHSTRQEITAMVELNSAQAVTA